MNLCFLVSSIIKASTVQHADSSKELATSLQDSTENLATSLKNLQAVVAPCLEYIQQVLVSTSSIYTSDIMSMVSVMKGKVILILVGH